MHNTQVRVGGSPGYAQPEAGSMSADDGRLDALADLRETVADDPRVGAATDQIADTYHLVVVALAMGFMFWIRARKWEAFVVDGEVLYNGNDPWYHLRMIQYTVAHFPETMPYEVWTRFPIGTSVGQFGTLLDQVVALAALIVGLGAPEPETIQMVHLFAPAVIGTLLVVPTYLLGRRLGGRSAGVLAVATLAFAGMVSQGGSSLINGIVGRSDHHIAEALFAAIAGLAVVVALQVADREKPVVELVGDRDVAGLRRPIAYAALAGVAIALYMSMWPPAIYFVGLLGIYATVQALVTYARGGQPEPLLLVLGVTFAVAGLLPLGTFDLLDVKATKISLIHVGLPLAGTIWVAGLIWLARDLDRRALGETDAAETIGDLVGVEVTDRRARRVLYVLAVVGTLAVAALLIRLIAPTLFSFAVRQFTRVAGFAAAQGASGTIGEVTPLRDPGQLWSAYRVAILLAAGMAVVVVGRLLFYEARPERVFVVLWFAFSVSMTFTQARFMYYLAVPTVVLAAAAAGEIIEFATESEEGSGLTGFEIVTIVAVVILLVGPLAVPPNVHTATQAPDRGIESVEGWQSSLSYLASETPDPGNFGTASNADELESLGEYPVPADGDYDYPDGSYGVISWWDYGHWITVLGDRIPTANPFQEGTKPAARFLLADSEAEAESAIEDASEGPGAETRYVAVDYQMAQANAQMGGKFFAPSSFVENKSSDQYVRNVHAVQDSGEIVQVPGALHKPAYYHTMSARLYRYHGSMREPSPVVSEWNLATVTARNGSETEIPVAPRGENQTLVRDFLTMEQAEQYVENNSNAQIGGVGPHPADRVPALEHYRLVNVSTKDAGPSSAHPGFFRLLQADIDVGLDHNVSGMISAERPANTLLAEPNSAWTKIFERVPGATIEGEGPEETDVYASVEMRVPTTERNFTYTQRATTDAQGEFEMTVPYATTGHDRWGPDDGATRVSVRATGPYEITTSRQQQPGSTVHNATVDVSNAKVIGRDDQPVRVELEPSEIPAPEGDQNATIAPESG